MRRLILSNYSKYIHDLQNENVFIAREAYSQLLSFGKSATTPLLNFLTSCKHNPTRSIIVDLLADINDKSSSIQLIAEVKKNYYNLDLDSDDSIRTLADMTKAISKFICSQSISLIKLISEIPNEEIQNSAVQAMRYQGKEFHFAQIKLIAKNSSYRMIKKLANQLIKEWNNPNKNKFDFNK